MPRIWYNQLSNILGGRFCAAKQKELDPAARGGWLTASTDDEAMERLQV